MNKTVTARELLKLLQEHKNLDRPVVISDENQQQGYYWPVTEFSILHDGTPVLHISTKT